MKPDIKVLLLSRYDSLGASSRIRSYQYIPYLERHGVSVEKAALFDDSYLICLYGGRRRSPEHLFYRYVKRLGKVIKARRYDLIWIEKELFPYLPAWAEPFLGYFKTPYLVDYDDAVFHRYDSHPNPVVRALLKRKIDAVMRHAALVTAGNEYLARRALRAGARHVAHLPTVIDSGRYRPKQSHDENSFVIGWIGSMTTTPYLSIIRPALEILCRDFGARISLVGAGDLKWGDMMVSHYPWSESSEIGRILEFDVGVMPLPDDAWSAGKCGYKLIQYMGCALPVVASKVGVNPKIVDEGKNGFIAQSIDDWIYGLIRLQQNPALRSKMGKAGRKKVEAEYSLLSASPRLLHYIQKAVSDDR